MMSVSFKAPASSDAQHAHPGALRYVDFLLIQVFPHGWPFVQCLQQDFWPARAIPSESTVRLFGGKGGVILESRKRCPAYRADAKHQDSSHPRPQKSPFPHRRSLGRTEQRSKRRCRRVLWQSEGSDARMPSKSFVIVRPICAYVLSTRRECRYAREVERSSAVPPMGDCRSVRRHGGGGWAVFEYAVYGTTFDRWLIMSTGLLGGGAIGALLARLTAR